MAFPADAICFQNPVQEQVEEGTGTETDEREGIVYNETALGKRYLCIEAHKARYEL